MKRETLISLDLEFNQPSQKVIQIGIAAGSLDTRKLLSSWSSYVNPGEPLNPRIADLCGVTQGQLDAAPSLEVAFADLSSWLKQFPDRLLNPLTWGGGDAEMLREQLHLDRETWCFGRRWIDAKTVFVSWRLARNEEYSGGLARSMTKMGLRFIGRKHNAMSDAENTLMIYFALLDKMK